MAERTPITSDAVRDLLAMMLRVLTAGIVMLGALPQMGLAKTPNIAAPFACQIDALCETGKNCIWMPKVTPTTFFAFQNKPAMTDEGFALFRFEGLRERPTTAVEIETVEMAKNWVFLHGLAQNISAVMTGSQHVADARGFQIYDVQCFGSGKCRLSSASVLISCNSA